MYTVSDKVKALLDSNAKQTVTISLTNGTTQYTITESDIIAGTLSVDRYSSSGETIEIGSAIASELKFTLNNSDGKWDGVSFESSEIYVEIGVNDNKIPLGYFIVDNSPRPLRRIEITALDRMVKFDKLVSELTFPKTVSQLISLACSTCGVTCDTSLTSLQNRNYSVADFTEDVTDATWRTILQWCGQLTGTNAMINHLGNLEMKWYTSTDNDVTITTANRYSHDIQEKDVTITGICYTADDEKTLVGTDDYVLDVSDNALINTETIESALNGIYAKVGGFTYRPYSATVTAMPYLYPMDMIHFVDSKGVTHDTIVTNVNYAINRHTVIAGKGETSTSNGYASPYAGLTVQQKSVIDKLRKQVQENLSAQENASVNLTRLISNSLGLYLTKTTDSTGAEKYYFSDAETLAGSNIIYTFTASGFAWTDKWDGDSTVWQYGITEDGNAIFKAIAASQISADQITTGRLESKDGNTYIDLDTGEVLIGGRTEGKSAYEVAVDNGYTGTESEWLTSLKGDKGAGLDFIVGTQTAATGSWTGVASFSSLEDGQQITYWLPYAGSGSATLNLTLSDGTTTGAKNCYYGGTTRLTTHYPAGSAIRFVYRSSVKIGSSTYSGWWADANYDTNNYDRIRFNNSITAKTAITASRLIVGNDSGFYHLAANTEFDITKPILWAASAITASGTGTNNYISYPSVTLRNNLSGITLTKNATCYLVGTLSGKTFTPSTTFFTSTIPTSEDGLVYISLGLLISTYQIYLYPEHPIYQFINGSFKAASQIAYEAQGNVEQLSEDLIIESTVTEYQLKKSADAVSTSESAWSSEYPSYSGMEEGVAYDIWVRDRITYASGDVVYSEPRLSTELTSRIAYDTLIEKSDTEIKQIATRTTTVETLAANASTNIVNLATEQSRLQQTVDELEASITKISSRTGQLETTTANLSEDGLAIDSSESETKSITDTKGIHVVDKESGVTVFEAQYGNSHMQQLQIDERMTIGSHEVKFFNYLSQNGTGFFWRDRVYNNLVTAYTTLLGYWYPSSAANSTLTKNNAYLVWTGKLQPGVEYTLKWDVNMPRFQVYSKLVSETSQTSIATLTTAGTKTFSVTSPAILQFTSVANQTAVDGSGRTDRALSDGEYEYLLQHLIMYIA